VWEFKCTPQPVLDPQGHYMFAQAHCLLLMLGVVVAAWVDGNATSWACLECPSHCIAARIPFVGTCTGSHRLAHFHVIHWATPACFRIKLGSILLPTQLTKIPREEGMACNPLAPWARAIAGSQLLVAATPAPPPGAAPASSRGACAPLPPSSSSCSRCQARCAAAASLRALASRRSSCDRQGESVGRQSWKLSSQCEASKGFL